MRDAEREKAISTAYLCATSEQFEDWRRAARLSPPPFPAYFCADCTPSYKMAMMKKGWCARTDIRFKKTSNDGIEGFVPSKHNRTGELF